MDQHFFFELANRYLAGTASAEEKQLVEAYYEHLAAENVPSQNAELHKQEVYLALQKIIQPPAKVKRMHSWWKVAAAAIIILAVGTAAWLVWFNNQTSEKPTEIAAKQRFKNDITPANGGAVLTLADGSKIYLDSTANGALLAGNTRITKQEDRLTYTGSEELSYNTVSTDKGKNYQLVLADGTRVWLDALSSIRFPTAFPGADRVVELSGQAYLEVARNVSKPFKVKIGEEIVQVLGTQFNVNAHQSLMKTTLVEGSVMIQSAVLKPGEQAQVGSGHPLKITPNADLEEALAWKNGKFRFRGNTVEEIFSQLSRWYDIEVVYQDEIPEVFVANISRDVPISRVLNLLEMTKQVQFTIEGKRVVVMKAGDNKGNK
jgi:transmembrane sensor